MTGPGDIVLAMRQVIRLELDLSTLRRAIGGGSYVRGGEYARQQAVLQTTWDAEDTALRGMVRGQGGNVYQTAAFFSLADGRPAEFETSVCSCPLEFNCKHVVALVLSVLEPGSSEPGRPQTAPPAWRQSLDSLLDQGGPARGGTTPLAIELTLTGGPGQPRRGGQAAAQVPLRLIARVVRPGKNGGWVAGDLSWGKLDALGWFRDHGEEQVRLLRQLYLLYQASGARGGYYGYHYGDDRSIEFSSIGSRQLWPLLDEAAAAGLQLVYPGKRGPLARYQQAAFCLDVTNGEDDGLRIVPCCAPLTGSLPCRWRLLGPRATARCASTPARRTEPSPGAGDSGWFGWTGRCRRRCSGWRSTARRWRFPPPGRPGSRTGTTRGCGGPRTSSPRTGRSRRPPSAAPTWSWRLATAAVTNSS
jgi:hypothetical protein